MDGWMVCNACMHMHVYVHVSSRQNSYSQKRPHLRGYRCWVSPIGKQRLLGGIGVGFPLSINRVCVKL